MPLCLLTLALCLEAVLVALLKEPTLLPLARPPPDRTIIPAPVAAPQPMRIPAAELYGSHAVTEAGDAGPCKAPDQHRCIRTIQNPEFAMDVEVHESESCTHVGEASGAQLNEART